jgi:hypothetical protein
MTLTVVQLREHVTSSLVDAALQRLLDAAYAAIAERAGAAGNLTESLPAGHGPLLMLSHQASAIVSVTEDATGEALLLDADDYRLRPSGSLLERLDGGTHPHTRWRGRIDLTYTLADDTAERDRVALELVELDVNFQPGASSETIGAWSESVAAAGGDAGYHAQREAILESLHPAEAVGVY